MDTSVQPTKNYTIAKKYLIWFCIYYVPSTWTGGWSPKGRQESLDVIITVYTLFAFSAVVGPKEWAA